MSAPGAAPDEPPVIEMARSVLRAVAAAEHARAAVIEALQVGQRLGVAVFGFAELMLAQQALAVLVNEHGLARALATNELATHDRSARTA